MRKLIVLILFPMLFVGACSNIQSTGYVPAPLPTVRIIATLTNETANILPTSAVPTSTVTYTPYPNSTPLAKLLLTTDDILSPEVQDWDFVSGIIDSFLKEEPVYVKDKSYDLKSNCLLECTKQIWATPHRYLEITMIRAKDEQESSHKAEESFNNLNPYGYEYGIDEYKWINAPTQNTHIGFSKWNNGYVLTTSTGAISLMIISYPSRHSDDGLYEVSLMAAFANLQIGKLKKANLVP